MPSMATPHVLQVPFITKDGLAKILDAIKASQQEMMAEMNKKIERVHTKVDAKLEKVLEYVGKTNKALLDMVNHGYNTFHGVHKELKEELIDGIKKLLEATIRMDRKMNTLLHALNLPPIPPAFPPTNARIIEVPSSSATASLFSDYTTTAPTIRIPILPHVSQTTPLPIPPVTFQAPSQPTIPEPSPSIPVSTPSPITLTSEPTQS